MNTENEKTEFLLSQYLDGELSPAEAAEVERRVAAEPELARQLERYRSLGRQMAGLGDIGAQEFDFDAQRHDIMAALERRALMRAPRSLVLRPVFRMAAMAAAAAVIVAAGAAMYFHQPARTVGPVVGVPANVVQSLAVMVVERQGGVKPSAGVVNVSLPRMNLNEVALAPAETAEPAAADDTPAGTVTVSFTARAERQQANPLVQMLYPM